MNKAINLEIYSAVKKGIKEMTKLISKAAEDNENKTKGLTLELQKLIHSKASKQELDDVASMKTNKVDTESVMESLRTVYKQFK